MALQTIDDLVDYAFRKLGSPVINIEVETSQAHDRVNDALEYFFERHYAGYDEIFIKKVITHADVKNGYITMDADVDAVLDVLSSSIDSGERMFNADWQYAADQFMNLGSSNLAEYQISMSHLSLMQDMLVARKEYTFNPVSNRFVPQWDFSSVGSSNIIQIPLSQYVLVGSPTVADHVVLNKFGTLSGNTITATQVGVNTLTTTIDTKGQYVNGIRTLVNGFRSDSYSGNVVITVKDAAGSVIGTMIASVGTIWSEDVLDLTWLASNVNDIVVELSFTSATGDEVIELADPYLYYNNIVVVRAYKSLNSTDVPNVFDDRWVKRYTTALIKRQWGENISKFDGVQLPGGITMNGTKKFEDAVAEIEKLEEDFSNDYELPAMSQWA